VLQAAQLNVGVLYVLAWRARRLGVVLAGWASNNRWSLLGGIRGSAQMISYEIAMGLALIGVVLTYGTLDLQDMVRQQGELLWGWLPRGASTTSRWPSCSSWWRASPSRSAYP
jgi:NADH-quinone oxidoreductase subunit H